MTTGLEKMNRFEPYLFDKSKPPVIEGVEPVTPETDKSNSKDTVGEEKSQPKNSYLVE